MQPVLALVLAVFLVAPSLALAPIAEWPLTRTTLSVAKITYVEAGNCTAFSINERQGYYMTAAHCLDQDNPTFLDKSPVAILAFEEDDDLAVIRARVSRPALPLATDPEPGTELAAIGFGRRMVGPPMISHGVMLPPTLMPGWPPRYYGRLLMTANILFGMSGGPLINRSGRVVSVVQCLGTDDYYMLACGADPKKFERLYKRFD